MSTKTVTLQNGKAVPLDAEGYIQVHVDVDLEDLMAMNYESILDMLSEKATGSPCLIDIQYTVIEVHGDNELRFIVTGDPADVIQGEADFDDN
jgi:hypothetical protein